ncbi:MAG: hydantoinase/oxoprolinase family protein [Sulfitobacter sp.]
MQYRLGIDIGGTFTDIVLYDDQGRTDIFKIASTPEEPGKAVVDGVLEFLKQHKISHSDIKEIVHGTTVGSNTILQKVGAKTALVTTKGFRDVLEIGRIRTPGMFDLTWEKPVQLVARRHRVEVVERMSATGEVVTPLDKVGLRQVVAEVAAEDCEAVAICFLNSYSNPAHEIEARAIIEEEFPDLLVTASCEVLPEMKEYERTSTTVVNAYLLMQMRQYLTWLEQSLKEHGFSAPMLVVNSAGGVMGVDAAKERPVFVVGSGPAGGVAGAAKLAAATSLDTLVAFDMGGTTAKASIVENNQPMLINEYEFREGISSPSRFNKGGGYMIKVPAIDVAEVGAGGGSIAWIDAGGMLQVGPVSAGAIPGPAAYGLGNEKPTVTDANIYLGMIGDAGLAGGSLPIERSLSERAIRTYVAEPLNISVDEAALGIRQLANVNMARAIRSVTVERGLDPREMAMMAFGGGGALHAADLAKILGIKKIIVPAMSGVFCSVGMLSSDVEHKLVRSTLGLAADWSGEAIADVIVQLRADMLARLAMEGFAPDQTRLTFGADLRYFGQSSDLTVDISAQTIIAEGGQALQPVFDDAYETIYGYRDEAPAELVNLRVTGAGIRDKKLDFTALESIRSADIAGFAGHRSVCFQSPGNWQNTKILHRDGVLECDIQGPAILVSYDSTIAVPEGVRATTDGCGSIVLEIEHAD